MPHTPSFCIVTKLLTVVCFHATHIKRDMCVHVLYTYDKLFIRTYHTHRGIFHVSSVHISDTRTAVHAASPGLWWCPPPVFLFFVFLFLPVEKAYLPTYQGPLSPWPTFKVRLPRNEQVMSQYRTAQFRAALNDIMSPPVTHPRWFCTERLASLCVFGGIISSVNPFPSLFLPPLPPSLSLSHTHGHGLRLWR